MGPVPPKGRPRNRHEIYEHFDKDGTEGEMGERSSPAKGGDEQEGSKEERIYWDIRGNDTWEGRK